MNRVQLPKIESRTLDNGLRVLAVTDRNLPLVTIVLMIEKGAEADEEERAGQADLTLEMLTLGTESRSSEQIALDVDSLGARLGFYSVWDASFIELEGLSEDLRTLLEIMSDIILHPTFTRPEFDQLKARRIASLIQDQDESEIVADVEFTRLAFAGTPYGHPRRGTVDSVKKTSLEDLEIFRDRHFLAGQCVLIIAGDVEPKAAFGVAEEFLGALRKGSSSLGPTSFLVQRTAPRRVRIVHRPDLTQSQIRMGHAGIERTNPDYHAFQVANYVLGGGGFSSRLMEEIRSKRGYTYGVSSHFQGRKFPGPFLISTFTPNETTPAVVEQILKVVNGFLQGGATPKELEEAKNFYLGSYPFRFETPHKIAREVLEAELYGLGLQSLAEYPQNISGIHQTDIETVVKRHVCPEAFSVVIVGNGDVFQKAMERIGPVETVDFQSLRHIR